MNKKNLIILVFTAIMFPLYVHAGDKTWNIDYCNTKTIFVTRQPIDACHIVEPGETLWGLAEKYYGNGFEWRKLQYYTKTMRPNKYPENPRQLAIGSKLVVWRAWEVGGQKNEPAGWGIDYKTGDVYTTRYPRSIYVGDDLYDGLFEWLHFFTIDKRTNNKIYVAVIGKSYPRQYTVLFNKERNSYSSPGYNFGWMTFSPDGKYYAIRQSVEQDVPNPQFIVLSNMDNGLIYDFSDSLIWYDNDTIIYRAQNNDEWRVVVNHKDYKVFNYLENLRIENGVIKFDARHDDGLWTKEEIDL